MDPTAVAMVLGLLGSGGAIVYYPMSIQLQHAREELQKARTLNVKLKNAAQRVLSVEREIDAARDLDPRDELRVLLDADTLPGIEAVAESRTEPGHKEVEDQQDLGAPPV